MDNGIPERQNEQEQVDLLAAQRALYARAKWLRLIQFILCVVVPPVFLALCRSSPLALVWSSFVACLVMLGDAIWLGGRISGLTIEAASLQELFDRRVLQIPYPDYAAPPTIDLERVMSLARTAKDRHRLRDWYPSAVGKLPLPVARIVCQRTNCRWDSELHRRWGALMKAASWSLWVGVCALGLLTNLDARNLLLLLIVPALPVFLWFYRESRGQNDAWARMTQLKDALSEIVNDVSSETVDDLALGVGAVCFQKDIFEHRRESRPVPSWLHRLLRARHQEEALLSADEIVRRALARIGSRQRGSRTRK